MNVNDGVIGLGSASIRKSLTLRGLFSRAALPMMLKALSIPAAAATIYALFSMQLFPNAKVFNDVITDTVLGAGVALFCVNIFYYFWMTILLVVYRPKQSVPDAELPTCVIIVPAYNEGELVAHTIRSLLANDYPADKLQIIAINDGSKDDTWQWMERAAAESNGRVETMNLRKNVGKREALFQGIVKAKGDIIVTVDSDSVVEKNTLRNLVSPFVGNPKIGGVAGNVRVLNTNEGMIPKMLDVRFLFSFEFVRSAQSVLGSVICTPGALSAYRKDVVMKVLDVWVNRLFMGLPVKTGEDRALTNLILAENYDIVYQSNSVVWTKVPTTYGGLTKMLIRWARSNVRENLYMAEFAFKRFGFKHVMGRQLNLVMQILWQVTPCFFLPLTVYYMLAAPSTFLPTAIGVIMMWSSISALFYFSRTKSTDALWSYVYGVFHSFSLAWIAPYSIFTVRKSGWLTRELPTNNAASCKAATESAS